METVIHKHAFDARRRLGELGISTEALMDSITAGLVGRLSCSPNDAPFIPGTEAWRMVVRTLRDKLLPLGWRKADPGNYSLVINDARRIQIVVASADDHTCETGGSPRTKSLKGLYTEAAIARNRYDEDLFPETLEEDLRRAATVLEYPTWILMVNITDDFCRAELSFPGRMKDGQVVEWIERIFLPEIDNRDGIPTSPELDAPDIDVPVRRKA